MPGAPAAAPLPPYVNHGPSLLAVNWIEAAIGLIFLAARLYTRARIVQNVGWDDWMMILATVLALMVSVVVTMEVHYGVGQHAGYLAPPDLIEAVKWIWISAPFSTMSACFGKISIALLLMRIINRNRIITAFLWVLIGLLLLVNVMLNIITFVQCRPSWWLWEQLNPMTTESGTCWDPNIQKNYGYFQGAFSSFSDLALALLPIMIIKDLQIELKLKIALMSAMSMGILATVAAIVKTVELKNLSTPDFTFNAITLIYWYISENWLIVIAACIPTLGPLYFVLMGKRTAESYAAQSRTAASQRRGNGGRKWVALPSWKFQSPIARKTQTGSDNGSRVPKGNYSMTTPKGSRIEKSFATSGRRSVDEKSDSSQMDLVELKSANPVHVQDGTRQSANIVKTTQVKVQSYRQPADDDWV